MDGAAHNDDPTMLEEFDVVCLEHEDMLYSETTADTSCFRRSEPSRLREWRLPPPAMLALSSSRLVLNEASAQLVFSCEIGAQLISSQTRRAENLSPRLLSSHLAPPHPFSCLVDLCTETPCKFPQVQLCGTWGVRQAGR